MTQITPYLTLNGRCREAMTFYNECLGGELSLDTVEGSPIESECPTAIKHYIMHATLVKGDLVILATDLVAPSGVVNGNNVALLLNCSSEEEINTLYLKFGEGGTIIDPLGTKFWGALFGELHDRFGVRWMFNYDKNMHQQ